MRQHRNYNMSIEIDGSVLDIASLVAYYKFSTGALTTDSGNGAGHTLTAVSAPSEVAGKYGTGASFITDDAYSATDHADFKPTGAFSVSTWIYSTPSATQQMIFQSFSRNTNYAGIYFSISSDGYAYIRSCKNSGTVSGTDFQTCSGSVSLDDSKWHFIVGTWDTTNLNIFVDGISAATPVAWANAPVYAATNYVRVACENRSGTNQNFSDVALTIDDLAVWNGKALTATEVLYLYGRTFDFFSFFRP